MAAPDQTLLDSRRAFAMAQQLLAGQIDDAGAVTLDVGWHETTVDPELGAVAVVQDGAGLDDWIGETLRVTSQVHTDRSIFVYVLGSRGVPTGLSLSRRAFLALGLLSLSSLTCSIEVTV